jgi:hypothetical protein
MVLLASSYDESKYFKAADLADEIQLKIKTVTEEKIGLGAEQEVKGKETSSSASADNPAATATQPERRTQ